MATRTHRLGGPVLITGEATVALWEPSAETHLVKNLRFIVQSYETFPSITIVYGLGASDAPAQRFGIALIQTPATIWSDDTWFVFEPGEQMYFRVTRGIVVVSAFGALLTNGGE